MGRASRTIRLVLLFSVALAAAPPADAGFLGGIMDKIKGFFGGGSSKQEEAFGQYLDQVEATQQAVFDLETQIIERYNQNPEAVSATDPETQQLLNQLADASRTNEDTYLQLLKARGEAQDSGVKLGDFQERLDAIQENQRRLEEGYQEIQDYNRDTGFFEPPPDAGGAQVASTGASEELSVDQFLNDPRVQGYIDEWLAMNGLDEFGRKVGAVQGGVIRANYNPDTDQRARHRYVWDHLWQKTGGGRITLHQYVMDRLDGGAAAPPATQEPPVATQVPATLAGSSATDTGGYNPYGTGMSAAPADLEERGQLPTSPGISADLAAVNKSHQELLTRLQQLNATGEGNSEEAQQVLEQIKQVEAQKNALLRQQGGQ